MGPSKVELLVDARNNASPKLQQVQKDLRALDGAAGLAAGGIGGMAAAAGVAGVAALSGMAVETLRLGSELKNLSAGLDRLAAGVGSSSSEMLNTMTEMSGGMVAQADLILQANKAINLGVAKSADDMAKLMSIAIERGPAMGRSLTEALDDIVTGLGRGSAMILDNLGIVVKVSEVNEEYAKALGKTAAELTATEQKQALINAVMAQSGGKVELAIDPTQQLAAAWKDFRAEVGLFLAESTPLPGALSAIAGALRDVRTAMAEGRAQTPFVEATAEANRLQIALEQVRMEMSFYEAYNNTDSAEYAALLKEQNRLLAEQAQQAVVAEMARLGLAGAMDKVAGSAAYETAATYDQAAAQNASTGTALSEADAMEVLRAAVDRLAAARDRIRGSIASTASSIAQNAAEVIGGDAALALYQDINKELTGYEQQLRAAGRHEDEILFLTQVRGDELRKQYGDLYDTTKQVAAYKSAVKEVNQEFEQLKGTVASVLSSALDTGTGVDPDDVLEKLGLPREDALNENARRLADIAQNGLKGQDWLSEFRKEVPGVWDAIAMASNPQEEAARMLKEFQQGLRPELIDKDKAKELVRAMILGEQSMSAMAEEIATELAAEMGLSVAEVKQTAGSVLGVQSADTGKASGSQFSAGAVEGLKSDGAGTVFVDEFLAQVKVLYERIKTAGKDAGKQWGTGFLETVGGNVPPALVDILVRLVLPGVQAGIDKNATLTGPQ